MCRQAIGGTVVPIVVFQLVGWSRFCEHNGKYCNDN